jgi:N-acetylmuramoyl-L-alanine amidase
MNELATWPFATHAMVLRQGDVGEGVADLQRRLIALGFDLGGDDTGVFGEGTSAALRQFQVLRGLRPDGVCDRAVWGAVVEAGFRLGDRVLYRRRPMLRGDDVAELQRRLSALGFDTGAIDGIFGDLTRAAVAEFQRNVGLHPDGICGRQTVEELRRLAIREGTGDLVSRVRERLRAATVVSELHGRRIGVGEEGGFANGAAAVCRALASAGAVPVPLHHPDASQQAALANLAGVDCYLGLRLDPDSDSCSSAYYRGFRYESAVSRALAEHCQRELPTALGLRDGGTKGMALPILRETRMPAVLVEIGHPARVVERTSALGRALVAALLRWADELGRSEPDPQLHAQPVDHVEESPVARDLGSRTTDVLPR